MNLLLLCPADFTAPDQVTLHDRRFVHLRDVLRAQVGDSLSVGMLQGLRGSGHILTLSATAATVQVTFDTAAPAALPLTLLLALPRPKMLRRTLQTIATMGVKRLVLINSYRVEKSYWQTPLLEPENLREQLLLGLEQAGDTVLPEVELVRRFKPFVEDELPARIAGTRALVAHPGDFPECPRQIAGPAWLAVGPEGGFIPYEIDKLVAAGFSPVQLGQRILRVETAVPVLLARLF
jgi:RsmE family RNA methyltransferase